MKGYSPIINRSNTELNSQSPTSFIELGAIPTQQKDCNCEHCIKDNCECDCHK